MPVMHATDPSTNAWAAALSVWEAAVRHSGWHPVLAAAAHVAIALLCLAAGRSARCADDASPIWSIAAAVLLLLAMNTLFAFDLLLIALVRDVARTSGWYEGRRELQAMALGVAAAAGVAAWVYWRQRLRLVAPVSRSVPAGLALLAGLAALRFVSLHATDELISNRLAGLTVGRLIEVLGLGLMATGIWRELHTARV